MRIAVDMMGADHGIAGLLPAVVRCATEFPRLSLTLVGDESGIESCLADTAIDTSRIEILHSREIVELTDKPSVALRQKRDASMFLAIDLVKKGAADACVSAGNTGALMAISRHLLKTVPGIDRPAIIKAIPSAKGQCYLLDLGANINCDAENLVQFAAMGSLMCGAVEGIERPRVGLLNIGEEEIKGEDRVRTAAQLLKQYTSLDFIGFVEGDGIYLSDADVLVCDGWVGNVALKTSEGLARFVSQMIESAFSENILTRIAAKISEPVLRKLREDLSPEKYNGATLLGLNGIIVKSHSGSDAEGFYHAIREAIRGVEQNIPALLQAEMDGILGTK
ncbi:MAG: phosphate acyltransferase PlsX [Pseudomonadales bacterium]